MSELIRVLFVTGKDRQYHDHMVITPVYEEFLSAAGFSVTSTTDLDAFLPANVKEYDVILLNTIGQELSREQERGLLDAVIGAEWGDTGKPKGLVGLHTAAASFKGSPEYQRMLGGRFLTHPAIGPEYRFDIVNPGHPVTQGVSAFSLCDELYLLETYPPMEVLVSCMFNGFERPIAWAKPYGRGRVFYSALGHGPEQVKNSNFQRLIVNAVRWAKAQ
jgi:uncharacterized protein